MDQLVTSIHVENTTHTQLDIVICHKKVCKSNSWHESQSMKVNLAFNTEMRHRYMVSEICRTRRTLPSSHPQVFSSRWALFFSFLAMARRKSDARTDCESETLSKNEMKREGVAIDQEPVFSQRMRIRCFVWSFIVYGK